MKKTTNVKYLATLVLIGLLLSVVALFLPSSLTALSTTFNLIGYYLFIIGFFGITIVNKAMQAEKSEKTMNFYTYFKLNKPFMYAWVALILFGVKVTMDLLGSPYAFSMECFALGFALLAFMIHKKEKRENLKK